MSWAALVAGACSGSTVTAPSRTNGGEPIGGQSTGGDSGPAVAGAGSRPGADTGGSPAGVAGLPGISGRGGTGGSGTGGGGGGSPPGLGGSRLGRACTKDPDCRTANETDLKCISETSTVLGNGAPPRGLCTRPCATDDECAAHSAGAVCYAFGTTSADGNSSDRYCLEGCQFGSPAIGETKCHARPELACSPALLASTGDPCSTSGDCAADELCAGDTCSVVFAACLPSCRGDLDCGAGMYCDQSFSNGLCRTTKPTGKRLGEPCTVPAAAEPDGCLGFCQADSDVGNKGHCAATCGLAHECAWDAASQRFDGICFYASVLTAEVGAAGDFGFCTPSCNCSEQCNDPTLSCQLLEQGALGEAFKGPGLCFAADAASTPYEECATGGAGAGGAGSVSSAGFGGAP